ncbi:MAG: hypothetical protein ACI8TP_002227 [Acidimicrobiales bacterium]|jgi:hypothetical protein
MTDAAVERLSRWTAARTTRRSFLHRLGQFAVMVAAGPTIAGFLLKRAEARVCGQSGVTPKCDTFDCNGPDDIWGWCWYANDGCCRNDGLKKICDCCTVDYPNVHGYCPSGSNVRCIVESCGTDPRVLHAALTPIGWEDGGYNNAAIRENHRSATRAVIVPIADAWAQVIAAPLAGTIGAPMVTVGPTGPSLTDLNTMYLAGVRKVLAVGAMDVTVAASFAARGIDYQSVADSLDHGQLSIDVAAAISSINDINRTVTVVPSGLSAAGAPLAALMAALNGFPIAFGTQATTTIGMPTLYIGPEPADVGVPAERTSATNMIDLSIELADLAATAPFINPTRLTIAPDGSADLIDLVNLQTPVVLHPANRLGSLEQWLQDHSLRYGALEEVYFTRGPGELSTAEYWRLQAAVNGFRVDQLTGQPGEGLPVTRQPWAERPIGLARTDGARPVGSVAPPNYWTDLGQTLRR